MRTELVQNSLEMAVRNCHPIKGMTIFHVESGDCSTRPLKALFTGLIVGVCP